MDFFELQAKARRDTSLLLFYFGVVLAVVIGLTYLALAPFYLTATESIAPYRFGTHSFHGYFLMNGLNRFGQAMMHPGDYLRWVWRWPLFCEIGGATALVILGASLWKWQDLKEGAASIAATLDARPLNPESDLDERTLRDVVEEMSLAAQLPPPPVYVLEDERGINAFAAGYKNDVALFITRGCLKLLSRDELQGVIGHELSHIANGDTILKMRLMGLAHGVLAFDTLGRILTGDTDADDETTSVTLPQLAVLGFALRAAGFPGVLLCRWIKSAIFREREWLADAAATQYTRNPSCLANAMKKVGGLSRQGRLSSPYAETMSHLFFVSYEDEPFFAFLASHPPLEKRIRALEPNFDGVYSKTPMLPMSQGEREHRFEWTLAATLAADGSEENIRQIVALRELGGTGLNEKTLQTPAGALALVYALLLSDNPAKRAAQLPVFEAAAPQTQEVAAQISPLSPGKKLRLLDAALPILKNLAPEDFNHLMENASAFAGHAITSFLHYTVFIILGGLRPESVDADQASNYCRNINEVLPDCAVVFSALARSGADKPSGAPGAFAQGVAELDAPRAELTLLDDAACDLGKFHLALEQLRRCTAPIRQNIVWACAKLVAVDHRITDNQSLLLRAIAERLQCETPAFARTLERFAA
ncbi:MAG TPA: M48 family metalloprotease [Verrucomicrobiae bacterium]|jgi:Zn-dependent protease with chaperone function|nr:M48 family metalloprotease [Verrucomicrobiae bacterium]